MANKHSRDQIVFILKKLARSEPPREIVENFKAVFPDTGCEETDVRRLMPGNMLLPPDLHGVYIAECERVKNDPDAAPYADQKRRLQILSGDVDFLRSNNQRGEARAVLRQIAEELGAVGPKGKSLAAGADDPNHEPVVAITRTIVDPKQQEETPK